MQFCANKTKSSCSRSQFRNKPKGGHIFPNLAPLLVFGAILVSIYARQQSGILFNGFFLLCILRQNLAETFCCIVLHTFNNKHLLKKFHFVPLTGHNHDRPLKWHAACCIRLYDIAARQKWLMWESRISPSKVGLEREDCFFFAAVWKIVNHSTQTLIFFNLTHTQGLVLCLTGFKDL